MSITIKVTTGGLTKVGKRFTYHIWEQKDIKRVANRLKKLVKKYPPKKDLYGVGQEVYFYMKAYDNNGNEEGEDGALHNAKDVDNLMYDIRRLYLGVLRPLY